MELPQPVLIHNELLGLKGSHGSLIQICPDGYYLISTAFGSNVHRVQLPIDQTILIFEESEEEPVETEEIEIER